MRVLFLDCFSGISGDMTVGALCDLGVKPSTFEWELSKLEIGDFHMHFEREQRQAIEGIKFGIHEGATHRHKQDVDSSDCNCSHDHGHEHSHEDHAHAGHEHSDHCCHDHQHEEEDSHVHEQHSHQGHGHSGHEHSDHCCHDHQHGEEGSHGHVHQHGEESHEHGHHHCHDEHGEHRHGHEHSHGKEGHSHAHSRSFSKIRALIEQSDLSEFVKKHAVSIFHRVAVSEGKIHGKPPEEVAFHEVGALDSIADIVCACVGIEQLGVEQVLVSPLHDGHGWIDCAHGHYPIPSTATLEILRGIPLAQIDEPFELITPTGAAIVAEFGRSFGVMPRMRVEKIGYGVGSRKLPNRPNVLRAILGEAEATPGAVYQSDTVTRIETNLDDLSPEITGAILSKLLDAGALDAFLTPIQMKKNRPAVQLTVLCDESALAKVADLIFSETTSFGIRMDRMERWKLDRKFETVTTPFGDISVKLGLRAGEIIQVAPEFESCRAASDRTGQPLRAVYDAALRSYRER